VNQSSESLKGSAMKSHIVAAIAAAAAVMLSMGCSTTTSMGASPSGSSMPTGSSDKMCQVFQGYAQSRGITPVLQEECTRQMGAEGCRKCLGM
jgi:hypothetical protein